MHLAWGWDEQWSITDLLLRLGTEEPERYFTHGRRKLFKCHDSPRLETKLDLRSVSHSRLPGGRLLELAAVSGYFKEIGRQRLSKQDLY